MIHRFSKYQDEESEFVFNIVGESSKPLRRYAETWMEVSQNFRVIPYGSEGTYQLAHTFPYVDDPKALLQQIMLKDPETFQTIITLASNYYLQLFGDDEFVHVSPGLDENAAADQDGLIRWAFRKPRTIVALWKILVDVGMFGFGWVDTSFDTFTDITYGPSTHQGTNGLVLPDISRLVRNVIEPGIASLSVFHVYPDWSQAFGQDMEWYVRLIRTNERQVVSAARNDASYDRDAVADALALNGTNAWWSSGASEAWREMLLDGLTPEDYMLPSDYRPVELLEFRGTSPFHGVDDPDRFGVITVMNGIAIRPFKTHPYGKHPLYALQANQFNGRPFGMGAGEVIRFEQDRLDATQILQMEAESKLIRAPYLVGMGGAAVKYIDELTDAPSGQAIRCEDIGQVKQLQHDFTPFFAAMQHRGNQKMVIRQAVGASDLIQGLAGNQDRTAAEAVRLEAYANAKLGAQVDVMENSSLPQVARALIQRAIVAWRDAANPDFELQRRLGRPDARFLNLVKDQSTRFIGSKRFRAQFGIGTIIDQMLAASQVDPTAGMAVDWVRLFMDRLKAMGPDVARRYVLSTEAMIGKMIVQAQMNQAQVARAGAPSPSRPQSAGAPTRPGAAPVPATGGSPGPMMGMGGQGAS